MLCTPLAYPDSSATLHHRMKWYSLAAAAAGVSTLALSQPADAKVVITNKNIPIPFCTNVFPCSVPIDLNGDGVNDFKVSLISSYDYALASLHLNVAAQNGGGVMGAAAGKNGPYASCLLRGAKVGASDHFLAGKDTIEDSYIYYRSISSHGPKKLYGEWGGNHPNRFLGVNFKINGQTHYGWIRITVKTVMASVQFPIMTATITEYGYETIANKSLGAGLASADPADDEVQAIADKPRHPSLGTLALGADGLPLWRREETLSPK